MFSPSNATLGSAAATVTITNDDAPAPRLVPDQPVIDLGADYGKLILPVNVDGKWYYYWDRSGDGSSANKAARGYSNSEDITTHNVLDAIFTQDANGLSGGGGNTSDVYRYATLNGVKVALPTIGEMPLVSLTWRPGTAIDNRPIGEINPTYDDLLAIWDAYNGSSTGKRIEGVPEGWHDGDGYWAATPTATDHAAIDLGDGYVWGAKLDTDYFNVALQVLF